MRRTALRRGHPSHGPQAQYREPEEDRGHHGSRYLTPSLPLPFCGTRRAKLTRWTADCTPKALTHRIGKFKAMAKNGAGENAAPDEKKSEAPKGKGKGGKAAKKADTPLEEADDDEIEVKPKTATGGKRKKVEADEGDEIEVKKVKVEEEAGDAEDEF